MPTIDDKAWITEYAKRSLAGIAEDAKAEIRAKIDWIRTRLDDAERRLDRDEMPNTCGILQGSAAELEMALAKLATMRDAASAIRLLTDELDRRDGKGASSAA